MVEKMKKNKNIVIPDHIARFSSFLRARRKELGKTLEDIAKNPDLKLTISSLSSMENGYKHEKNGPVVINPTLETLVQISQALEFPVNDLLGNLFPDHNKIPYSSILFIGMLEKEFIKFEKYSYIQIPAILLNKSDRNYVFGVISKENLIFSNCLLIFGRKYSNLILKDDIIFYENSIYNVIAQDNDYLVVENTVIKNRKKLDINIFNEKIQETDFQAGVLLSVISNKKPEIKQTEIIDDFIDITSGYINKFNNQYKLEESSYYGYLYQNLANIYLFKKKNLIKAEEYITKLYENYQKSDINSSDELIEIYKLFAKLYLEKSRSFSKYNELQKIYLQTAIEFFKQCRDIKENGEIYYSLGFAYRELLHIGKKTGLSNSELQKMINNAIYAHEKFSTCKDCSELQALYNNFYLSMSYLDLFSLIKFECTEKTPLIKVLNKANSTLDKITKSNIKNKFLEDCYFWLIYVYVEKAGLSDDKEEINKLLSKSDKILDFLNNSTYKTNYLSDKINYFSNIIKYGYIKYSDLSYYKKNKLIDDINEHWDISNERILTIRQGHIDEGFWTEFFEKNTKK